MDLNVKTLYTYTEPLGKKQARNAIFKDCYSYMMYLCQFIDITLSRFKMKAPYTVDKAYVENALLNTGSVCLFKDEYIGWLMLPFTHRGKPDAYGNPVKIKAYGNNGYTRNLVNNEDCVIIYNNPSRTPTITRLMWYAERLFELDEIEHQNAQAQSTPYVLTSTEGQRLTVKNVFKKIISHVPVIEKPPTATWDIDVLKLDAPYVADKIQELKKDIWNECMTYLGVPTINAEKKERMVVEEVTTQTIGSAMCLQPYLNERLLGADRAEKLFGERIIDFETAFEGGIKNGNVHRGSEVNTGITQPNESAHFNID